MNDILLFVLKCQNNLKFCAFLNLFLAILLYFIPPRISKILIIFLISVRVSCNKLTLFHPFFLSSPHPSMKVSNVSNSLPHDSHLLFSFFFQNKFLFPWLSHLNLLIIYISSPFPSFHRN